MERPHRPGVAPGGVSVRFLVFLAVALLLHASLIVAGLLWEGFWSPPPPPPEPEPIAVELVEEPPQPEPPANEEPPVDLKEAQQEPPPAPEAQQEPEPEKAELPPTVPLDEAPAFDAPKSARNDQELTQGNNTSGPPVVAALAEPQPPEPAKPPQEPVKPVVDPAPLPELVKTEAKPEPAPQEAPTAETLPPDAEGLPAQAQTTPVEPAEPKKAEPDKPDMEEPDAKRFAFFAPLPKMEFEAGAKASRAPSGNAEATYTSTLYGMIVPLVRVPPGLPPASRRRPLRVEFVVDGRGNLMAIVLSRSSGVPSLDVAALAAIRQAAPFPPTPHGKALGLVLDYAPQ